MVSHSSDSPGSWRIGVLFIHVLNDFELVSVGNAGLGSAIRSGRIFSPIPFAALKSWGVMNHPPVSLLALSLFLVWGLAGCSRETDSDAVDSIPRAEEAGEQEKGAFEASKAVDDAKVLNPEPERPEPDEPAPPVPALPTVQSELQKRSEAPDAIPAPFPEIRSEVRQWVRDLYVERDFQPVWFEAETLQPEANAVVGAFSMAESHGLDPGDYFSDRLEDQILQWEQAAPADRSREGALLDWALTLCVTALAYDLHQGRIPHREVISSWDGVEKEFDAQSLLSRLQTGENPREVLETYAPSHEGYERLRQALTRYREIARAGGWNSIDPALLNEVKDRELETGSHPLVPLLRDRLGKEGYDVADPVNPDAADVYDESIQSAVKQFQANRGLDQDGIVGPLTLKAINIPIGDLLEKIVWSMERWRWLPEELGDRHILVNVPEFMLRAYASGEKQLQMGVIVGDAVKGTWTPIFADEMEYVIFRPYWNVPWSIIEGELLPEIEKDRRYLKKFNYEIVDRFSPNAEVFKPSRRNLERVEKRELKIRQTAGPYNALGLVKFIFPNRHSVYLHDTNQRGLFVYSKRDFSHGCIRVADPEALADYALPAGKWTEETIREAMYEGERQMVFVGDKLPVYIFYLTAFAEAAEGPIGFFEDLYYYDAKMTAYKERSVKPNGLDEGIITAQTP